MELKQKKAEVGEKLQENAHTLFTYNHEDAMALAHIDMCKKWRSASEGIGTICVFGSRSSGTVVSQFANKKWNIRSNSY